jgi:hypothetical protein
MKDSIWFADLRVGDLFRFANSLPWAHTYRKVSMHCYVYADDPKTGKYWAPNNTEVIKENT